MSALAATPDLERARRFYERSEYGTALEILQALSPKDGSALLLTGQCYYMSGDAKAASTFLEKAVVSDPRNPRFLLWLGRAYNRRAETANIVAARSFAIGARRNFEAAVRLDPRNMEAIGDLFEYYLAAPRLLGGGVAKAAELASRVRYLDVAEYHYELARLAGKHKQFQAAEHHYRLAVEWAPNDPSRLIDLAEFVEARGRQRESDEIFRRAREIAPRAPIVWFEQARTYVTSHRNIATARSLLKRYLSSSLTPEDPPRYEATKLLSQIPDS
jgi:tetratricopeptide (TPR) repeat protein